MSRIAVLIHRHLQNARLGNVQRLGASYLFWGAGQIYWVSKGFCRTYSRLAALCCFSVKGRQLTFYGLVTKAHALGYIYFELEHAGADMAKCLLIESSCVGHVFK